MISSQQAWRIILNSSVVLVGCLILAIPSSIASVVFYNNYVPDHIISIPIHLQYGLGPNPYGRVELGTQLLKESQLYDISLILSLPLSPPNTQRGNFMASLRILSDTESEDTGLDPPLDSACKGKALYHSRRPVLIPYKHPAVSLAYRALFLPYHLFSTNSETCILTIPLADDVMFTYRPSLQTFAYVELEAGQDIQTYHATLQLTAQLHGLRGWMYAQRTLTVCIMIGLFWLGEVSAAGLIWLILSAVSGPWNTFKSPHAKVAPAYIAEMERPESGYAPSPIYAKQPSALATGNKVKVEEPDEPQPSGGVVAVADDETEDPDATI